MKPVLETKNLKLREFNLDDSGFIIRLLNSPSWLEFIGDRKINNKEDAQNYLLLGPINSYFKFGFGLYLVQLKQENVPVGMCGLIKRETLENVDLGFAFLSEYCGKGFAFEAASATLGYAKNELGLNYIAAITEPHNTRSIRLLKKLGFGFEKPVVLAHETEELLLFGKFLQNIPTDANSTEIK